MNVNWSKHFRELGIIGNHFGEQAYIIINRVEDARFFFSFFFFLVLPVYCYQPISLHPRAHMLSHVIPWTSARQSLPSMDFSRQEYWSGLPFPSPEDARFLRASNVRLDVSQWDSTGLVPHLWGIFVYKSDGEFAAR